MVLKNWRKLQTSQILKTREEWFSGEASTTKIRMICGKSCVVKWRRRCWRSTQVEEDKKGAHKGRGEPGEWRIVKKEKSCQPRKWCEDFWKGVFSWLTQYGLQ